jgi:hypothetical protein
MKISMDKKYKTRDGRPVRILCVDAKRHYPVVGLIANGESDEDLGSWPEDGSSYIGVARDDDLVEVVEPKYRPFANIEEFKPHRGRWVGCLGQWCRVKSYDESKVWVRDEEYSWNEFFHKCIFEDGSPCGVRL